LIAKWLLPHACLTVCNFAKSFPNKASLFHWTKEGLIIDFGIDSAGNYTAMSKSSLPPAANLFLENQLCFALYAASLTMTKTYRPLLAMLNLTYPQYVVMMALWQQRELTAGALAQAVALDAGTLVPLVRKLVAQGLLARRRSDADERVVLISITPAGQALQQRAHAVHDQMACSTQRSPSERKSLIATLQALRSALGPRG